MMAFIHIRIGYDAVWSLGVSEDERRHSLQISSLPPLAQLVRASSLYLEGPWFESKGADKHWYRYNIYGIDRTDTNSDER